MLYLCHKNGLSFQLIGFVINIVYVNHLGLFCDPMGCSLPSSSVHGIFLGKNWSGLPFPSQGALPNPGMEQGLLALQTDSLPS